MTTSPTQTTPPRPNISKSDVRSARVMSSRRTGAVVAASLGAGLILAAVLCLVVFPGAVEAVITGAALIGFGAGWALLAGFAGRTGQPQNWAWLPAVLMVTTGVFLVVETPGQTLSTLGWVWLPVMAATAVYCMRRMRRDLQGSGRWLLYPVITSMLVASVGGLYLQVSRLGDNLPVPGHLMT